MEEVSSNVRASQDCFYDLDGIKSVGKRLRTSRVQERLGYCCCATGTATEMSIWATGAQRCCTGEDAGDCAEIAQERVKDVWYLCQESIIAKQAIIAVTR